MKIKECIGWLEEWAPPILQENYDNSGLLLGDKNWECTGALVCLDSTEAVVEDAIAKNCNLIIAHHPIVFGGLKRITGKNYVERTVIKAIKNDIAIYAIHTNLDHVMTGVNSKFADLLGLQKRRILKPKQNLMNKLAVFCPVKYADQVKEAMFEAGAGALGDYDSCSFTSEGLGTFKPKEGSKPFVGKQGELHKEPEVKIEVIVEEWNRSKVISTLKKVHPYEEVAFDLISLKTDANQVGSGMVGQLESEMKTTDFLLHVKKALNLKLLKYTNPVHEKIKRVAICGGAGSFLLPAAKGSGAQVFITSDYKYHEFFDAENNIIILDVGHYESEIATIALIFDKLKEKFTNFALHLTEVNTNPVNYL